MSAAEAPLPIEEQIQQLGSLGDAMASDEPPDTQDLLNTQVLPVTQAHADTQDLPSSQEVPNDQDLGCYQVNSSTQEHLNTQQHQNTSNLPNTREHPPSEDIPNTQEPSTEQNVPNAQVCPDTQTHTNNQSLPHTPNPPNEQGVTNVDPPSNAEGIPNIPESPRTEQHVPNAQVRPDTQAQTNTQSLPNFSSPPIEQDVANVEPQLNAEDIPNTPENPTTEEPVERRTVNMEEAPNTQHDPTTSEFPLTALPRTEQPLNSDQLPNIQNPLENLENQNIEEPPNVNQPSNQLETPSIEELLVREVSSALEPTAIEEVTNTEEVTNNGEVTNNDEVTNNEEPVPVRKRKRSDEVEEESVACERADARHPKRHKSSKKNSQDNKKAKAKSKCKTKKKTTKKEEAKLKNVEALFGRYAAVVEMPTQDDFDRICGPLRTSYSWGPPKSRKAKAQSGFAPPPAIPPAGDDSGGALNMPGRYFSRRDIDNESESDSEQERTRERERKAEKKRRRERKERERRERERRLKYRFLQLPTEIREEIYRYLLVSPKPVMVRAGWMRVYEREKPGLSTGILRVNKRVNEEAARVLYSENTFLYRLRDPPNTGAAVADIQGLVDNDDISDPDTDYEGTGDFGYKDSPVSQRSSKKKRKPRWDINLTKFGEYFRHLTVQAEYNRYDHNVMQSMAKAISVFTAQPGNGTKATNSKDGTARAANINTFTIRVAPMATSDGFTFVNFFKFNSPVIKALRQISCQRIRVEILTQHLDPTTTHAGLRLIIDMRYRRFQRRAERGCSPGQKDIWHNDPCMLAARAKRIRGAFRALKNLEQEVYDSCRKCAAAYMGDEDDYWADGFWFEDEYVDEEMGF